MSNCSMLEAIATCEEISGRETPRYDVPATVREIHDANRERWATA
jgi:hypothetical protein